jgi:hypothetical protein
MRRDNVQAGQRWYDETHEQRFTVLGKNYVDAWLLQYEDGDVVEWERPMPMPQHLAETRQAVYLPAPREIEKKRPTLEDACDVGEHVFLGGPYDMHEAIDRLRCGICGVEKDALAHDLEQGGEINKDIPYICHGCGKTTENGEQINFHNDYWICPECQDHVENGYTVTDIQEGLTQDRNTTMADTDVNSEQMQFTDFC